MLLNSVTDIFLFFSSGGNYKYHLDELAPAVRELAELEKQVQQSYLNFANDWSKVASWIYIFTLYELRILRHFYNKVL